MTIKIGQPLAFSEQGRKDQQEDRIYPAIEQLSQNDRCFVLCDGMGGHELGEVAAGIVSKTLYDKIMANPPADGLADAAWFSHALCSAYDALDKMDYSSSRKPGTTMTCVYLADNGVLCAHIGDSRIYVVRPGEGVIYRTEDHSLVNQLVKIGEITPEEAEHHPKRNIITRAMQPGLGDMRYAADVALVKNIREGDYIFMCCDGILEQLSDAALCDIVSADSSPSEKLAAIYDICFDKTRDNYTCILLRVDGVDNMAPADDCATVMGESQGLPQATENAKEDAATLVTPEAPVFPGASRSQNTGTEASANSARTKAGNTASAVTAAKAGSSAAKKASSPKKDSEDTKSKGRPAWIMPVVLLVVLLAVGAGVYFFMSGDKKNDAPDKPTPPPAGEVRTDSEEDKKNRISDEVVESLTRTKIQDNLNKLKNEILGEFHTLGKTEKADIIEHLEGKRAKVSDNAERFIKSWIEKVKDFNEENSQKIEADKWLAEIFAESMAESQESGEATSRVPDKVTNTKPNTKPGANTGKDKPNAQAAMVQDVPDNARIIANRAAALTGNKQSK